MKKVGISPLIEKYNEVYLKDPSSRVFAPLAEGYRQAGLLDKAQEILKNGIRHNPTYLQGYITLGNCYYDLGEFNLAYTNLRPLISENRDNIRLQKLFASTCVELGNNDEALESYKYLLFLNPKDQEVSRLVAELEEGPVKAEPIVEIVESERFELDDIEVKPEIVKSSLDEWIKVDLKAPQLEEPVVEKEPIQWKVEKPSNVTPIKLNIEPEIKTSTIEESPVITHSLVDLYINQGHLLKAKELLNKILELNPNEKSSMAKLEEVNSLEGQARLQVEGEEEGRQRLMDTLDAKLGQIEQNNLGPIEGLKNFLDAIQKRSENRKNSQI